MPANRKFRGSARALGAQSLMLYVWVLLLLGSLFLLKAFRTMHCAGFIEVNYEMCLVRHANGVGFK